MHPLIAHKLKKKRRQRGRPRCRLCQGSGLRAQAQVYPWGGVDYVYVPCTCMEGNAEEQNMLEAYGYYSKEQ
jgi:hypothetical protein